MALFVKEVVISNLFCFYREGTVAQKINTL